MTETDVCVIGGGIVGLSTAMTLSAANLRTTIIETENSLAKHQTGHNSGVIHTPLYYKPGSAKAKTCSEGRQLLLQHCRENKIPFEKCGKLVLATSQEEILNLQILAQRGLLNGIDDLDLISAKDIQKIEPAASGVLGLHVRDTAIVDYKTVARSFANQIEKNNGQILLDTTFKGCTHSGNIINVKTNKDDIKTKILINCAGLYSDRVARLCGDVPEIMIVPFRGEYYHLKRKLTRGLVYPVPNPELPFLGVHFTKTIDGNIECGPNAVLAFSRQGYKINNINFRDLWEMSRFCGFWKMAKKFWKVGVHEVYRSVNKRSFWHALQKLVPSVQFSDLSPGGSGIRAQALDQNGKLLDDFLFKETIGIIHVLNSPSPAATASMSIGKTISEKALRMLNK